MGERIDKIRLISFIKSNQSKISLLQKTFVDMFNECGKKYNSQPIQLALTGSIITIFLKNTSIPNQEIRKLLDNLSKKFK